LKRLALKLFPPRAQDGHDSEGRALHGHLPPLYGLTSALLGIGREEARRGAPTHHPTNGCV
jgi:hypothetical protein